MKKIIDFLRRIGLLHIGSGDYISGEYDDRKDLKKENKEKSKKHKKLWSLWIFLFIGFVSLFFSVIMLGFSFWFFIVFILWAWFFFFVRKIFRAGFVVFKPVMIAFSAVFIISFVLTLFFIPSDSDTSNSLSNTKCKASFLKNKTDNDIKIKITDNADAFLDKTKSNYTLDELNSLSYGYDVEEDEEGRYVLAEICDGDISVSHTKLDINDTVLYQASSEFPSTGGNVTQFVNEQSDGSLYRYIEEPGKYQIYVYSSRDGEKWITVQEFNIEIK